MILSPDQAAAVRAIHHWYRCDRHRQQIFYLSGYAGVGKTTIVNHAIAALNLLRSAIAFGTYTMKAALVMRRNGLPASTIHKLIYQYVDGSEASIEDAKDELADLRAGSSGMPHALWLARVELLERFIANPGRVKFIINRRSIVPCLALIVLDEVSMVDTEMADHLRAFGKPMLVVGDPAQLEPIRGVSPFASQRPDVLLTEIHRQAAGNPIIRLASLARRGEPIPYGDYGASVRKLRRNGLDPAALLDADQVIAGMHTTRRWLNNRMKAAAGYTEPLPAGRGEKIIGLKNNHSLGIFNGQFFELTNIEAADHLSFTADLQTEDGDTIEGEPVYLGHFLDHVDLDPKRAERDQYAKLGLIEPDWGWAVTCHKAQGSGWPSVVVVDDGWGHWDPTKRKRWLYTAITRAADVLTILD